MPRGCRDLFIEGASCRHLLQRGARNGGRGTRNRRGSRSSFFSFAEIRGASVDLFRENRNLKNRKVVVAIFPYYFPRGGAIDCREEKSLNPPPTWGSVQTGVEKKQARKGSKMADGIASSGGFGMPRPRYLSKYGTPPSISDIRGENQWRMRVVFFNLRRGVRWCRWLGPPVGKSLIGSHLHRERPYTVCAAPGAPAARRHFQASGATRANNRCRRSILPFLFSLLSFARDFRDDVVIDQLSKRYSSSMTGLPSASWRQ